MTKQERLAAAEANLATTRRNVQRSPESLALEHLLHVVRELVSAPSPVKRVPLGKAPK